MKVRRKRAHAEGALGCESDGCCVEVPFLVDFPSTKPEDARGFGGGGGVGWVLVVVVERLIR